MYVNFWEKYDEKGEKENKEKEKEKRREGEKKKKRGEKREIKIREEYNFFWEICTPVLPPAAFCVIVRSSLPGVGNDNLK